MEILKFEDAPQRPTRARSSSRKSSSKTIAGLAAAAVIAVVGSTLAANITLASATGSEFGQGIAQATACDDAITIQPKATFANSTGAGTFSFTSVDFSGIKDTCASDVFTVKGYGDTSSTAVNIASWGGSAQGYATFGWATTAATAIKVGPSATTSGWSYSANAGAISLVFANPQATSGQIYKVTLETGN